MFTLPYNPVAVVPWIVGGLLSGLIFKSSARSPISGKGAGLAGHGTMVMLPLASSGAGNSAFEGRQGVMSLEMVYEMATSRPIPI